MTSMYFGESSANVSFVAFNNGQRYRVTTGFMTSISISYRRLPIVESLNEYQYFTSPYEENLKKHLTSTILDISINIPTGGFIVDKYDPLQPYPIGSKVVDECTVDELLFAIQHKLGMIKNV